MTTLNLRALQRLEEKLKEELAQIHEHVFASSEFSQFKTYAGKRDGLRRALELCEEVEKEINS